MCIIRVNSVCACPVFTVTAHSILVNSGRLIANADSFPDLNFLVHLSISPKRQPHHRKDSLLRTCQSLREKPLKPNLSRVITYDVRNLSPGLASWRAACTCTALSCLIRLANMVISRACEYGATYDTWTPQDTVSEDNGCYQRNARRRR